MKKKQKTHTSYFFLCAREPRRSASAVRGSEVNSLSCEGLGGSNPLCGPLETLLRASYREPQPPAIQNIHHHHHRNLTPPRHVGRLLEGGRRVGSGGGWKRLTRVNRIREVEKQRARQANKLLGRREVGCCRCRITLGRVDQRKRPHRSSGGMAGIIVK